MSVEYFYVKPEVDDNAEVEAKEYLYTTESDTIFLVWI